VALNESRIFELESKSRGLVFTTGWYVALLIAAALLILIVIYSQFNSLALKPLDSLTASVREVAKRNFELSLPVRRDDEIGKLSQAFNDMAAELHRLYRETDRRIVDLNARNRALLGSFPHAVIVLDRDGNLLQVNHEAEAILGSLGTPDRLPSKLKKQFKLAQESGEEVMPSDLDEALLFRIEDREHYFLPRVFRLPSEDASESSWGMILTDVSRFRWLDDIKMNLLATVSHEIKTPLTSIRMVLHLLLEQKTGKLTTLQEQMVSSASDDCERLLETLVSLLQLGTFTSGSKHLTLQAVEPSALLQHIPLSIQQEADDKGITLTVECSKSLPAVRADQPRIEQVIINLLSNAIKFGPVSSAVTLKAAKRGSDYVRFSVADQGPGVPGESQDRIFERFYRDPDQECEGAGLGLSIAREIINAHAGRIGFQSEAGKPTVFHFDLPLA
jgi:signal transduction histidine kinase